MSFNPTGPGETYGLVQTVAPTTEPVLPGEFIGGSDTYSRSISEDDVTNVKLAISAAREIFEHDTGLQLITATWALSIDRFPGVYGAPNGIDCAGSTLFLPSKSPWIAISSIVYVASDGTSTTLSSSAYSFHAASGRLEPAYGYSWPSTRTQNGAVVITFTAGYGTTPADVPAAARLAIKGMVLDWGENRALRFDLTPGVKALIDKYRNGRLWG